MGVYSIHHRAKEPIARPIEQPINSGAKGGGGQQLISDLRQELPVVNLWVKIHFGFLPHLLTGQYRRHNAQPWIFYKRLINVHVIYTGYTCLCCWLIIVPSFVTWITVWRLYRIHGIFSHYHFRYSKSKNFAILTIAFGRRAMGTNFFIFNYYE
jgi:hypothetical protein